MRLLVTFALINYSLVSALHSHQELRDSMLMADRLSETCKAIATHENGSGLGATFVTVLPQSDSLALGALALAADSNALHKMQKVSLVSLPGIQDILTLLPGGIITKSLGEYFIDVRSRSSLSAAFNASVAGNGGGAAANTERTTGLRLIIQDRHSERVRAVQ